MPTESAPRKIPARPSAFFRLLDLSWRRQSPASQDRYATLGSLVSVLIFLAAIVAAFWYLREEEFKREQESVRRDTEITQQQMRLRLIENQEQLVRFAREITTRTIDEKEFQSQAESFSRERPEITNLIWVNQAHARRAGYSTTARSSALAVPNVDNARSLPDERNSESDSAFRGSRELRVPVYSRTFTDGNGKGNAVFQLHVPLFDGSAFSGTLIAEYSIDSLVRYFVPTEVSKRHTMMLIDAQGQVVTSTLPMMPDEQAKRASIVHDVPFVPASIGLVLRGLGYRTSIGLIGNTLFWMVLALSVLTLWMLLGTWRHMRRRTQMQNALVMETNFRRAMENSMLTGMRAMDMEGRITYVNPAFCAMTGFSEVELIGHLPPFLFWPHDRLEENARQLQHELQGRSPAGGYEEKVLRKDGELFDARMYVSPLIDPKGMQTGWMTSITNITETNRLRDKLGQRDFDLGQEKLRNDDSGRGGYIFLDLRDDHKAMFHDVLKGFEEFSKLKGYSIAFSVDGSIPNKIAFKFTVLPSSTPVTTHTVQDDFKEYIRRVQSGDVDLSDLPRVVPFEQHEALLLAMRNRIIFLQHTYHAQKNVLEYYERVLRDASPPGAGIAPSQTFYLQAGGEMSTRTYTAFGSNRVVQGDNNNVSQGLHIARSFNEKKKQLDNLDQLIAILAQADLGEPTHKALISLEKVKDELTTQSTPNESRIKTWLDMAKDSMKALALGKDVVDLADRTFESFNISLDS